MGKTDYFDFKRFRIYHDRCSMKVGTDGVLLGAWADLGGSKSILDVGTGSGVVALIMAQRSDSDARITGLEKDSDAAIQAKENAAQSVFSNKIDIIECDFTTDDIGGCWDCIVSNPPFFTETLQSPVESRAMARHSAHLTHECLIRRSASLLASGGSLQVILPYSSATAFHYCCSENGLKLFRRCDIITVKGKQPKRSLLHFVKSDSNASPWERTELTLFDSDGNRTEEYARLTGDLYAK